VKRDPTDKSLNISTVSDAQLLKAGHRVCAELEHIPHPTDSKTLEPLLDKGDITLLLVGAHNPPATLPNGIPRADNGPRVLASGVAQAAIKNFCPATSSALND
jgi:hypothetical protein